MKSKKLVGGGEITIVNRTVPMALEKLGYAPSGVEEIAAFIDERNTTVGAPYVKPEHHPVFDCAIGDRAIHYMGHVKMMGAVQPASSRARSRRRSASPRRSRSTRSHSSSSSRGNSA